jgi:two-component system KDP operon response regulator KdpE
MNPVVLVIDDEVQMRRLLRVGLEGAGYKVCEAASGQEGLQEIVYKRPDVVLLDLGLPDMDGVKALKRLREWSQVPVVVLTVREDERDKVAALDAGADDYVTKPFSTAELLARLRVAQRHARKDEDEPVFEHGKLRVDFVARTVTLAGEPVQLTPTEYALLRLLIQSAGKVLTHRQILRAIWGTKSEEQAQYLRVYMTRLRKKLGQTSSVSGPIKTEAGIGYRLFVR